VGPFKLETGSEVESKQALKLEKTRARSAGLVQLPLERLIH
jgi:hypothetical protein